MNKISVYEQWTTCHEIDAPNHFANISAIVYHSESGLCFKRTVGCPLSSLIKTISVAFIRAEI